MNHTDKFDFMLRTKVPRNGALFLTQNGADIEKLQNKLVYCYRPGSRGRVLALF